MLHALFLTGMVVGLKVLRPPPEDRAMELRLIPAPERPPRPEFARRRPERLNPTLPRQPRLSPQPASETSVAALPQTPAPGPGPAPGPTFDAGSQGLMPGLSGRLGCEDRRLTPEQRQVCANNLAQRVQDTERLGLNIPDQKKAAYDLHVFCRDNYRKAGVPSMNQYTADGERISGPSAGLGPVPGGCLGFSK
jgi:hypothetical protein